MEPGIAGDSPSHDFFCQSPSLATSQRLPDPERASKHGNSTRCFRDPTGAAGRRPLRGTVSYREACSLGKRGIVDDRGRSWRTAHPSPGSEAYSYDRLAVLACIIGAPLASLVGRLDWALALIALVVVEMLVANRWRCLLTGIAARYTNDLPLWLARHNKLIFGALFVVGALVVLWRWLG